jgi:hypothetical protein
MRDNVGLHLDVYVVAFMGIAFLAASYGFYHDLPRLAPDGGYGPFIPLVIFGLLGAGLTLKAVHLVLRWLKYGGSQLKLETVPIPLGGDLRAEFVTSRRLRAGRRLRARLKCISATVTEGISINKPFPTVDERHTDYRVIWEDEDTLVSDGSGRLQIAFAIPADEPSATLPNDRGWRYWVLEVEDPSGRTQAYHAEFELPVFQAALGAGEATAVAAIVEARRHKLEDYKPDPGFEVRIGPAAEDGTEFLLASGTRCRRGDLPVHRLSRLLRPHGRRYWPGAQGRHRRLGRRQPASLSLGGSALVHARAVGVRLRKAKRKSNYAEIH